MYLNPSVTFVTRERYERGIYSVLFFDDLASSA